MTTIHDVEDFLALDRIAMVGVSRNPKDFSRLLFREMCDRGYDMVPINLVAEEIDGRDSLWKALEKWSEIGPLIFCCCAVAAKFLSGESAETET